jgi:hypothetical protein
MNNRTDVISLKYEGLSNADIARKLGISRERVAQILGKPQEAQNKATARLKTKQAIRNGLLIKKECFICGDVNSEAHHVDYDKPMEVVWVCKKHHRSIHSNIQSKNGETSLTKVTSPSPAPRTIRRSVEFESLLRGALSLTPEIKIRSRAWFPQLMIAVLKFYIENKAGKS